MLCLLLLQSLREIKEALAVFIADSLLPVVCHLVSHCDLALVWGLDVHLLGQELFSTFVSQDGVHDTLTHHKL